jgi:hypothetical protein
MRALGSCIAPCSSRCYQFGTPLQGQRLGGLKNDRELCAIPLPTASIIARDGRAGCLGRGRVGDLAITIRVTLLERPLGAIVLRRRPPACLRGSILNATLRFGTVQAVTEARSGGRGRP